MEKIPSASTTKQSAMPSNLSSLQNPTGTMDHATRKRKRPHDAVHEPKTKQTARWRKRSLLDEPMPTETLRLDDPQLEHKYDLQAVLEKIIDVSRGVEVIPPSAGSEIRSRQRVDRDPCFMNVPDCAFGQYEGPDSELSAFEPVILSAVSRIFRAGRECFDEGHPVGTWNVLVNWPILDMALAERPTNRRRTSDKGTNHLHPSIEVMPCADAGLPDWPNGDKMVDFCMYVTPRGEKEVERIAKLRARRASHDSINIVVYRPLAARPIAVGIATIGHEGDSILDAHRQLLDAHRHLRDWHKHHLHAFSNHWEDSEMSFLPSVVVQGHEWWFSCATREKNRMVSLEVTNRGGTWKLTTKKCFREKQRIGSTDSMLGIFQVVAALRLLAHWARDTYWPWYRQNVLSLH